jgi:hypothetical protein
MADRTISIEGPHLRLEVDAATGGIRRLRHLTRDLELISLAADGPAFRLESPELGIMEQAVAFEQRALPDGLRLTWTLDHGLVISSDVIVRGDDVSFTVAVTNRGSATVDRLAYPIIGGIGRLGGRGRDELAHTHATGMLFHDPLDLFGPDPENHRRLRRSPYPEGFAGATMQFLAYYATGRGGFLLATEDTDGRLKWLDVDHDGQALELHVIHKAAQALPGADLVPGYPVIVAPLHEGTWYEAGDRYRTWVMDQPWAHPEPRAGWLREEVGVVSFGINARHDRSAWLDAIHAMAGTPVFHVLGPNWAAYGQDYQSHLPRSSRDWFPAVFDPANLAAIRANGDRWAPFEFDLFSADPPDDAEPVLASRLVLDQAEAAISDPGLPHFPFMCPATAYWHDHHVERDARLVREHGPDALYYDISVNNVLLQCLGEGHGHPRGASAAIGQAYAAMYRDTNSAMARAAGRPIPAGSEMISERFLGAFDFYQARGESGPYSPFEVAAFRDWVLDGRAEKIPLFAYVFGSDSPVRMDGWTKLSAESGDLFYWVASQVLLNGGLLEINAEFSALEDLDDRWDDPAEHYYAFAERRHPIDPAKAAYIGEVARTRVGPANPFLARGAMRPAPIVEASSVVLPYFAYNMSTTERLYETRGEMAVPSVLATAWELDGRVAWLAANLVPEPQEVRIDGRRIALPGRAIRVIEL